MTGMRAYALLSYAAAILCALGGFYALGANWARPSVRLLGAVLCFVAAILTWHAAHQPWHLRWS